MSDGARLNDGNSQRFGLDCQAVKIGIVRVPFKPNIEALDQPIIFGAVRVLEGERQIECAIVRGLQQIDGLVGWISESAIERRDCIGEHIDGMKSLPFADLVGELAVRESDTWMAEKREGETQIEFRDPCITKN